MRWLSEFILRLTVAGLFVVFYEMVVAPKPLSWPARLLMGACWAAGMLFFDWQSGRWPLQIGRRTDRDAPSPEPPPQIGLRTDGGADAPRDPA